MSEPKRLLQVFLCHAHSDKEAVQNLYMRLTNDGVDAWLDKEKLLPGQDWESEIRKAVRNSDVVVVCHSKQFNQKGFRQKEVKIALEEADLLPKEEIFIIPARLEECDVLDDLKRWHWVDLFEESGYRRLMLALNEKSKRIEAAFKLPKQHSVATASDESFVKKVVEELEKQEEKNSFLKKIISNIRNFVRLRNIKLIRKSDESPQTSKNLQKLFGIFVVIGLAAIFGLPPLVGGPKPTPTVTNIESLETADPVTGTKTPITSGVSKIPTSTKTLISTMALMPTPVEITTDRDVQMVYVPSGEFIMGSGDVGYSVRPALTVYLDAFYIDKYEVSNAMYMLCVSAHSCTPPLNSHTPTQYAYYGDTKYADYPVVNISWNNAFAYCAWVGERLPSEAEWEKAARGIDGRSYPWGNNFDETKANMLSNRFEPVDSFPDGASVYGAINMFGNAMEWVNDWYSYEYYENFSSINPKGPDSGKTRVIKDIAVISGYNDVKGFSRFSGDPAGYWSNYPTADGTTGYFYAGFRCAKDATP